MRRFGGVDEEGGCARGGEGGGDLLADVAALADAGDDDAAARVLDAVDGLGEGVGEGGGNGASKLLETGALGGQRAHGRLHGRRHGGRLVACEERGLQFRFCAHQSSQLVAP